MEIIAHDQASDVSLRAISADNLDAVVGLKLHRGEERFVAGNDYSIALTWVEPTFEPFAIYHSDGLVGFCMSGKEVSTGRWWIVRLMIAAEQQGKGFGRTAMHLLMHRLVEHHGLRRFVTSYHPENEVAAVL